MAVNLEYGILLASSLLLSIVRALLLLSNDGHALLSSVKRKLNQIAQA